MGYNMKRKYIILILILLLFGLVLSLGSLNALDSYNWDSLQIEGQEFKIPPRYDGGEIKDNVYKNDHNYFRLSKDKGDLGAYGSDITVSSIYGAYYVNIAGHDAVVIRDDVGRHFSNKGSNRTVIHFTSGRNYFRVAYLGNAVTPEIRELIASTPSSSIPFNEFKRKLNDAQDKEVDRRISYISSNFKDSERKNFYFNVDPFDDQYMPENYEENYQISKNNKYGG